MKTTDRCKIDLSQITDEMWQEYQFELTRQRPNRLVTEWNEKNIFPYARFWEIVGQTGTKYLIDCKYQTLEFMYNEKILDPKNPMSPEDVGRDFSKYNGPQVLKIYQAALDVRPTVKFFDADKKQGFVRSINKDISHPKEMYVDNVIIIQDKNIDNDYEKLLNKPGFGIPVNNELPTGYQQKMWRTKTQEELDEIKNKQESLRQANIRSQHIENMKNLGIFETGDTLDENYNVIKTSMFQERTPNQDMWESIIDAQLDYLSKHPDWKIEENIDTLDDVEIE